jgi:hypothetical protein
MADETTTPHRGVELDLDDDKVEGALAPGAKVGVITFVIDGTLVDVISNPARRDRVKPGCIGWLRVYPQVHRQQEDWVPVTRPKPTPMSSAFC